MKIIECDVLVVGGGINGVGIARDAAGRGLSVVLCEKDDLASHTSSASSKLIHGGLRYLEHYEFRLVRKALAEREILLHAAPHLIRPLRLVMPHDRSQRPAWLIRAGLFLYDHLAKRDLLPGSSSLDLRHHAAGVPLQQQFTRGFVYSDARVDDARLVMANAIDASERGATILTRTRCSTARSEHGLWLALLHDANERAITVRARSLVNAAGPWAASLQQTLTHAAQGKPVRLVKGSHIVVPRLFDHPFAYIFQHPDRRIVFAIPYERDFTLVGTTDVEYHADANRVAIDADEIAYLCDLCNRYFKKKLAPTDVVWSYSGVRPLVEDASADPASVSRDYHFDFCEQGAPLLSIFGGKITTYRKLAEEAVDLLGQRLASADIGSRWTANACLPGGDLSRDMASDRPLLQFDHFLKDLQLGFPWLPVPLLTRYAFAYGSRVKQLLANRRQLADLGNEILPGLFEVEAQYWLQHEWALTAEDMLWRRSKLGLHVPADSAAVLDNWIATHTLQAL